MQCKDTRKLLERFRNGAYSLKCFLKLPLRSTDKTNSVENEGIALSDLESWLFSTLHPCGASSIPSIEVLVSTVCDSHKIVALSM